LKPLKAGELIYDALLTIGKAGSNPVLEVIPPHAAPVEQQHYPDPFLEFPQGNLRAYYHSHPQPTRIEGEHGHFHLFVKSGNGQWSHLAALSMDSQGQPRGWFATNRWVTDEAWLWSEALQVIPLPELDGETLSPLQQWLLGMLHLYHGELYSLWKQRDNYLKRIMTNQEQTDILENREHYVLSQIPIDLLGKLQELISEATV
jgi:hypothetical protein